MKVLLLLAPTTAAFHVAAVGGARPLGMQHRPRVPQRSVNMDGVFNATALIEDAVKSISGNEEYRFGDMTRGAIKDIGEAKDSAIKELSGKEASEYEFGDISKRLAAEATTGFAALAGESEYQFGDISRKVLSDADRALADARDAYFDELPSALVRQIFGGLSQPQRKDLMAAIVQLAINYLLCLSAVINVSLGLTISIAWAISSSAAGVSPLSSGAEWSRLLSTHATVRLVADPPFFPLRVLGALLVTPYYRRMTARLQRTLPMRERQPVLNRALSFGTAWLAVNVLGAAALTCTGVLLGGVLAGVPVFVR